MLIKPPPELSDPTVGENDEEQYVVTPEAVAAGLAPKDQGEESDEELDGVEEVDVAQVRADFEKQVQTVTLTLDSVTQKVQKMASTVSEANRSSAALASKVGKDQFAAYPDKNDPKKLIRQMMK